MRSMIAVWVMAFAMLVGVGEATAQVYVVRSVTLPATAGRYVVDESAQRAYVTLPQENRVAEVSLTGEMALLTQLATGFRPSRVALSVDGRYLYTTLGTSGSFTRHDRWTGATEETVIATLLDHSNTYDIVAGMGSEVFVSANASSTGFAYIVKVDTATGAAFRVASQRIIRAAPVFEIDRASAFLYIGEGFSPNSLYKLDIAQPTAPLVVEDNHGSIISSWSLSLNPSGTRIITAGGQVLRTLDLTQAAALNSGIGAYRPDGTEVAVYGASTITRYDATTLDTLGTITTSLCGITGGSQFDALQRGRGWLILSGATLCKVEDADFLFASGLD